ncbi:Na+/H+ antiporter subunit E [Paracoccus aminophilus]|uniref:Multicomponent K+:H+ antiporter, subunit E n=1 Tax=Paracoccus aminophilus JCM 7686 TaxID=1367847 RepID=S5YB52_PARAH|nr:Na+/H+ antiporter subunit E [Paracoccus aminophilus]AGT08663.1 multicomponent K+:H+ antiporter, subunit E [Paracoccus aminophilus JCM 7686]
MSRYLPHPILSVALVLMWMVLTRFSLGNLILGGGIATLAGWVVSRLRPKRVVVGSWSAIFKLAGIVGYDILKSNIEVAKLIIAGTRRSDRIAGFLHIHLRLTDRNALALLSIIITSTPGTAWVEYDPEEGLLLLHILDLRESQDWQVIIRDRYESLLMEIFE